jgi:hypothetical protein
MSELENLYGAVGLGLITLFLPYFLQVVKLLTNIDDRLMLWVSVGVTYLLVDMYYVATLLVENPTPSVSGVLFMILGMLIYPLLTWFGGQGIYSKMIRGYQK